MSSRRAQIRLLYQTIPPSHLAGTTADTLISRSESYLAAVDIWAGQGNAKAVSKAGSGLVAICAWKAAKALAENANMEVFQRASGLSPQQFVNSDRDLEDAIESAATHRKMASLPSTPRRDRVLRNPVDAAFSGASSSGSQSQDQSPGARMKRAREIMRGTAFATTNSSPLSRSRIIRNQEEVIPAGSSPPTPSKRTLRDRSSIKETRIFDPSDVEKTPTKVNIALATTPTSNKGTSQQRKRRIDGVSHDKAEELPSGEKRGRHTAVVGYPFGEPFRMGRFEEIGQQWDSTRSKERVQRYIKALQSCPDNQGWEPEQVVGQLRLQLR